MSKEQDSIPTGKVQRASRFVKTGVKVGGNYVKYYSKRLVKGDTGRGELDRDNAEDIYDSLSELKGSALKMAQMMSMDKSILPEAYSDKFTMAQYSAPPLSGPLVIRQFKRQLNKTPQQVFEKFEMNSVAAASIGQVHKAWKDGKPLAVKVQYPGVAESVSSDLKLVRPFATRILGLNEKDIEKYFGEVEGRMLEETDYDLELRRSQEISEACKELKGLRFPKYYSELSTDKILTMDWMPGMHMKEFLATEPTQEIRNKIGQALWDFYDFQMHEMKQVHADPHPGNFLMEEDGTVGIIDFGCVKVIPVEFYDKYFKLHDEQLWTDKIKLEAAFKGMEMINDQDSESEKEFFTGVFSKMIRLLNRPFSEENFDFGDDRYFGQIYALGEEMGKMKELRASKSARGPKDALYLNRTYFGLYSLLNQLKANVRTGAKRS